MINARVVFVSDAFQSSMFMPRSYTISLEKKLVESFKCCTINYIKPPQTESTGVAEDKNTKKKKQRREKTTGNDILEKKLPDKDKIMKGTR